MQKEEAEKKVELPYLKILSLSQCQLPKHNINLKLYEEQTRYEFICTGL
jgi:hypothetical protein